MAFVTKYDYEKCRAENTLVPYHSLHNMMRKRIAKPDKCSICNEDKKLELCNKSQAYLIDDEDWFWACRSCHRKHDFSEEKREKLSEASKQQDFTYMKNNQLRKGQTNSADQNKKISQSLKGRKHSPERIAAIRAARWGT